MPRPKGDATKFPRTGSKRLAVLRVIIKAGTRGITDEEMLTKLAMTTEQLHRYRLELMQGAWVEDSAQRRKTAFGDLTVVWRATPQARTQWEESGKR